MSKKSTFFCGYVADIRVKDIVIRINLLVKYCKATGWNCVGHNIAKLSIKIKIFVLFSFQFI